MKNIGILAVALVAALVLGFGARISNQTAHAQVTGTVVLGCEFLAASIDGTVDNAPNAILASDLGAACDGLSAAEIDDIAGDANSNNVAGEAGEKGLGDNDGKLEASDFDDIDLDANQIQNATQPNAIIADQTYAFAFVDNDGPVLFDSQTGITVAVNVDATGADSADADANLESCAGVDDLDCNNAVLSDGDGVVVARLTDGTAGVSTDVNVDISQSAGTISTETVSVVGVPNTVVIASLKDPIQVSGTSTLVQTCKDTSDVSEGADMLADINRTIVKATVTDNDDVELTRVVVLFETDDAAVATFDGIGTAPVDSAEISSDPKSYTSISVESESAGIGSFAVFCGGTTTGVASITATINDGALNEDDDSVDVNVTGEPDNVALTSSPAAIDCNGTATASVTATVTDSEGNNVADGTNVNFAVVALGTANPINVDTVAGTASSTVTPLSVATAGVTVIVTSGDAQASILVACNTAAAATAVPGAVPTPGTGIGGPDTGNGGYLGQDSSAGFPLWTLVALALGSLALVGSGMVTRRAGK